MSEISDNIKSSISGRINEMRMVNHYTRFFLIAGIIDLVVTIVVLIFILKMGNVSNYIEIEAKVSYVTISTSAHYENEKYVPDTYNVYFKYNVDDTEYENHLSDIKNKPAIGDKMTIYYNPENPSMISNTNNSLSLYFFPITLAIVGIICLPIGIAGEIITKYQKKKYYNEGNVEFSELEDGLEKLKESKKEES